ncbi:unnamed protein product [Lymnaea stagnalis]|uniref:Complex I-B17 n=1 Tax=Lymnaea stagnalis TaxID=6523 RepID=A0AAV2HXY2_LYMST
MADSKVTNKVDPVMEKPWQRAKRFERYDFWCKSAYPPMQIEPLPHERNRLNGEGMTAEQRALRKQWVTDQILHHEPREIKQLQPLNIFRRIYRWPADFVFSRIVKHIVGDEAASLMRQTIPKVIMVFGASYILWYHLKYHSNDWTRIGGINMFESKPVLFASDHAQFKEKDKTDYNDQGFKSRKALLIPRD